MENRQLKVKKVDDEQRIKWFLEDRCHLCGRNSSHAHPNHQWLCYPVPSLPEDAPGKYKEKAKLHNMTERARMEKMVFGRVSQEVKDFYESLK